MDIYEAFGVSTGVSELLKSLEAQLPLLSEADQQFVLGCRMNTDSGFPLDAGSEARLRQIQAQLTKISHDTLEQGSTPQGPSPLAMLRNIANIRHTLTPAEQQFANELAIKMQVNTALTPNEMLRLTTMHRVKGLG